MSVSGREDYRREEVDMENEHYGIHIANGAAATITEGHANRLSEADTTPVARPTKEALTLIAEIDGSMIPIVQTGTSDDQGPQDRRKTRKVFWKVSIQPSPEAGLRDIAL
jgi:hypothetical protein